MHREGGREGGREGRREDGVFLAAGLYIHALRCIGLSKITRSSLQDKSMYIHFKARSLPSPPCQMYYMFDMLLLLAKGKVAYFGPVRDAMAYFSSVGLHCDLQYNPADYMSESSLHHSILQCPCIMLFWCGFAVDLVTNDGSRKILIGEDPKQESKPKKL